MSFSSFRTLFAIGVALMLFGSDVAEAQIVRRFAGGGVQVNAPFVRVNVGRGGATSVRAPLTAVNVPGRIFLGRRNRLLAQPATSRRPQAPVQSRTKMPTPVNVDSLPYPTASQLAAMDNATLVESLREMMGRFNYRLSLLKTGEGWQEYLVLSRQVLGSPGAAPEAAQVQSIRKMLPRYRSVQQDPQFAKIASLPSFVAAYAALQEASQRLGEADTESVVGPRIADPSGSKAAPAEMSTTEPTEEQSQGSVLHDQEILPTPQPAELPNATRGERSILKRK